MKVWIRHLKSLLIRFWDETDIDLKMRYLGSGLFGHAAVKDLNMQFMEIARSLVPTKFFLVSMNVPNVNLKFYEALKEFFPFSY